MLNYQAHALWLLSLNYRARGLQRKIPQTQPRSCVPQLGLTQPNKYNNTLLTRKKDRHRQFSGLGSAHSPTCEAKSIPTARQDGQVFISQRSTSSQSKFADHHPMRTKTANTLDDDLPRLQIQQGPPGPVITRC